MVGQNAAWWAADLNASPPLVLDLTVSQYWGLPSTPAGIHLKTDKSAALRVVSILRAVRFTQPPPDGDGMPASLHEFVRSELIRYWAEWKIATEEERESYIRHLKGMLGWFLGLCLDFKGLREKMFSEGKEGAGARAQQQQHYEPVNRTRARHTQDLS
jgi:hypothetical protein